MKKLILGILLGLLLNMNSYCNKNDSIIWKNLKNAIEIGANQFINYEKYLEYTVFVLKVISFEKNKGVFSISYIVNDFDFSDVNPSHYAIIDNKLVLIRTDSLQTLFTIKSGFPIFSDSIKRKTFDILAGKNGSITGQLPPVMVFQYKKKKVLGKYYKASFQVEDKYNYWNNIR